MKMEPKFKFMKKLTISSKVLKDALYGNVDEKLPEEK